MKLGIVHERIEPGKPQQDGRHEADAPGPEAGDRDASEGSRKAQPRAFDRFRAEYNEQRPHEALGDDVPASFYNASKRRLQEPWFGKPFEYEPYVFETAQVDKYGAIRWHDSRVPVSLALRGVIGGGARLVA